VGVVDEGATGSVFFFLGDASLKVLISHRAPQSVIEIMCYCVAHEAGWRA
jgi:hypothetical protein